MCGSKIQGSKWNRAILLDENHKSDPHILDEGVRPPKKKVTNRVQIGPLGIWTLDPHLKSVFNCHQYIGFPWYQIQVQNCFGSCLRSRMRKHHPLPPAFFAPNELCRCQCGLVYTWVQVSRISYKLCWFSVQVKNCFSNRTIRNGPKNHFFPLTES
jgi:hypothetical protein